MFNFLSYQENIINIFNYYHFFMYEMIMILIFYFRVYFIILKD